MYKQEVFPTAGVCIGTKPFQVFIFCCSLLSISRELRNVSSWLVFALHLNFSAADLKGIAIIKCGWLQSYARSATCRMSIQRNDRNWKSFIAGARMWFSVRQGLGTQNLRKNSLLVPYLKRTLANFNTFSEFSKTLASKTLHRFLVAPLGAPERTYF